MKNHSFFIFSVSWQLGGGMTWPRGGAWCIGMCETWHIYLCDIFIRVTCFFVWHDSFVCAIWVIRMCNMRNDMTKTNDCAYTNESCRSHFEGVMSQSHTNESCHSHSYVQYENECTYEWVMSFSYVSCHTSECLTERWGAGVEYHFQEFNEPYAPS